MKYKVLVTNNITWELIVEADSEEQAEDIVEGCSGEISLEDDFILNNVEISDVSINDSYFEIVSDGVVSDDD